MQTLKVTYDYDAFGQLVRRTEQGAAGGAVTAGNFVHDGGQIVLVLGSTGAVQHRLLWGEAVDQALADEDGAGTTYWYLTDHLGTVRDVVNNSGTVVNHLQYDAFGRRTGETSAALNDFDLGYTGKWLDRATGLQWNLHRWYDASTARWLSEDPIGFAAGDANLRRYVGNQATSLTDPSGLFMTPGSGAAMAEGWKPTTPEELAHIQALVRNYMHYVNPFIGHHAVDGVDWCLQSGTRVGQAGAVIGAGGAAIVTATGTGGIVVIGGGAAGAGAVPGVGTIATLPPGWMGGAGLRPALFINGRVYVHYHHLAAQELSGCAVAPGQLYGWVEITKDGMIQAAKWIVTK